jgi:hypothetical protein
MMLDISAAMLVAAMSQAFLKGAGRRWKGRKVNLTFLGWIVSNR